MKLCRSQKPVRQGAYVFMPTMAKLILSVMLLSAAPFCAAPAAEVKPDRAASENALADKDFRNRRKALEELGAVNEPWKMDLLRRSLSDDDPAIREKAARLIGRSKDKTAYKLLVELLGSPDNETRLGAIDGLKDLGDGRAAVPLAALFAHKDRNTRWKAAEALGGLKADEGVDPLLKAARADGDGFVKKAAVESLGKIGSKKAAAALTALKTGGDKKLAGWAGNVLKSLEK